MARQVVIRKISVFVSLGDHYINCDVGFAYGCWIPQGRKKCNHLARTRYFPQNITSLFIRFRSKRYHFLSENISGSHVSSLVEMAKLALAIEILHHERATTLKQHYWGIKT